MSGYNFTVETNRALQAARAAADTFHHEYIGTEHILLGALADQGNAAATTLTSLGCDIDGIRATIETIVKPGDAATPAEIRLPYTSRAKKVLEFAMICARDDSTSVDTPQLLLGLLREKRGIGAQVLIHAGVTAEQIRAALTPPASPPPD